MKYTKNLMNRKLITKLALAILFGQLLIFSSPINLLQVQASPTTYADSIWEFDPGSGAKNDILTNAYPLLSESAANNPNTPLNVSTWAPDYYSFDVYPGFYFQVYIEFNPDIVYYQGLPIDTITLYPGFQADIDVKVYDYNNFLLEESTGWGSSEAIGPIYTTTTEKFYINVSAMNPEIGYENVAYSTTYNMSIIFDDVWELFDSNDQMYDLSDPYAPGGSDDELLPGVYTNLRFGKRNPYNQYSEHQDKDSYLMWFYQDTTVNFTISSFTDPMNPSFQGPDLYIYFSNFTNLKSFSDDQAYTVDTSILTLPISGWYYIVLDNSAFNAADHYTLSIVIEDPREGGGNDDVSLAVAIGEGKTAGLVVSDGRDDWYKLPVTAEERVSVDLTWFTPPKEMLELNLTVYENDSIPSSILDEARPIFNGLRFGPYRAFKDSVFIIHIGSNIPDGRYYNLTITLDDIDDRFEDNDRPTTATLLPASTKVYAPTESDPWAGLFALQYDADYFAIPLLPGDRLEVRINFNGTLGNLDMKLFDGSLNLLRSSELVPSDQETVEYLVRHADTYLFAVYGVGAFGVLGIDYNMTVIVDSFDDSFESNNFAVDAAPIAEGHWANLILRDGNDDWYYVYLHQNDVIEVDLTYFAVEGSSGEANDIDLDFLHADESLANRSHTLFNESISFTAPTMGRYYIFCFIDGDSNTYNLTINIIETDDIYEDNDVLGDATRITFLTGIPTQTVTHTMTDLYIRVRDDDFFVTEVPAGLAIIVELTFSSAENLDLDLYDLNGSLIDESHQTVGDTEIVGPFPANQTYAGDFYFRVSMPLRLNTDYMLRITVGPEALLITRETVAPHGNFSSTSGVKPDLFGDLIVLGGIGAIIGGGTAGALWVANKTGTLGKGIDKAKDLLGRGGTGGTGGVTPKGGAKGKKKPPS